MNESNGPVFRALDVQLEVQIQAPRAHVWESLTEGIGEWWPDKFYVGSSPRRFALEPIVGGRVYEDWGGDEGMLYGTVTAFESGTLLQWTGDLSADFGGPARSVTTFRLSDGESSDVTTLSFRDTPYGVLGDNVLEGLEPGWKWLLEACLRPFVETGTRPDRPASVEGA